MDPLKTKTCSYCHNEKLLNAFHKDAAGKYGRQSYCKACKDRWSERSAAMEAARGHRTDPGERCA